VAVGAADSISALDLSRPQRRRLVARVLLRALVTTVLLVAIYYNLPLDRVSDSSDAVLLVCGLLGVAVLIGFEVRAILKSQLPAIKAIEALAAITPLFLLLFAAGYLEMQNASSASFSQHLSHTDALYFTITTFATVGYGDITATTETARVVVMVQMLADLVVVGFGVKVIVGAVQMGRGRREGLATTGDSPPAPPTVSP